ncbi:MAG: tyrosine-type recombinase/integrase [Eggerthellaceae bacterium]|nr:tyrosine-type recombinase/integrase [Eggerthellaceae bacterium]
MRKHYVVPLEKKDRAKCRTWQLRVDSGRKTPKGAISWKTRKVTGMTWSQANDECDQWAIELDEGREVIPDRKWTFLQYREHWVGLLRDLGIVSASTVRLRESSLKAAGMHLDGYRLEDIRAPHVDMMTAALKRGDTPSGRPASGTYARKVVESVQLMLDAAVKDGAIPRNPSRDSYKPPEDTPEKRLITIAEVVELEAAMDPAEWHERVVLVLAETGMRLCEIMPPNPMLWEAWDERAGLLRVSSSKNVNGLRLVPVTDTLADALRVARFHLQLELGVDDVSGYPLAADDAGEARAPHTMRWWWARRRLDFGLEGVGLHQLRHAMVSHLLANGATLKQVQDIIGDKTGSMVLSVYAHTTLEDRAAAMGALDAARHVQDLYKNDGLQTSAKG